MADELMIQEIIPYYKEQTTVSFTAFSIEGEIKAYWVGEKVREHPIKYGTATLARSLPDKTCYFRSAVFPKARVLQSPFRILQDQRFFVCYLGC